MQKKQVHFKKEFRVLLGNNRSQAAEMTRAAGDKEGGPDNSHQGADQWLFVISGQGSATVAGKRCPLKEGMLLLIEKGETHEIRNTGNSPLKTINFYVPPAYTDDGDELPAGRPS